MAQFTAALNFLLDLEDRARTYAVHLDNNGKGVIAGVNEGSWPVEYGAIAAASVSERPALVSAFYLDHYWNPRNLAALTNQDVANRVMAADVNEVFHEGGVLLQRAVNALEGAQVDVDGVIGPMTIAAANACDPAALLDAFRKQEVAYYQAVVAKHPEDAPYLAGWTARAMA